MLRTLVILASLCGTALAQDHKVGVNKYVIPSYPPIAKMARVEGTVVLKLHLAPEGTVQEVSVLSGHPMLKQAAANAAREWKFICLDCKPGEPFVHELSLAFAVFRDTCVAHYAPEQRGAELRPDWTSVLEFPSRLTLTVTPTCIETVSAAAARHLH